MRKVMILTALGVLALTSGCSFLGNWVGVDFCPVWTPLEAIFGALT